MYLFIFEDGKMVKSESVDESILGASDSGYVDILDITHPLSPTRYCDGEWHSILDSQS